MGAVLAMMRLLGLLGLLMLAACGNDGLSSGALRGVWSSTFGQNAAPPNLRESLTPEAIARFSGPLLFVEVFGSGIQAGLTPGPRNGAVQQWNTQDGASLSLIGGVVTASRALGDDLISADVSDVVAALRRGAKRGVRVHRYLTHENSLEIRAFKCDYTQAGRETAQTLAGSFAARRVDESCFDSGGLRIDNSYWIDGSGVVRKSRQWLSPLVGYVLIERLKD
ncbi:YjbF family lipoprotein [Primorskyibacter sp. 2E107]|uniref:YjbF family lipoprotein n=1 Tax=Primorskyibacter sp. 2E107 TaxID=3403458 RepID=UPI003AF9CB8A